MKTMVDFRGLKIRIGVSGCHQVLVSWGSNQTGDD